MRGDQCRPAKLTLTRGHHEQPTCSAHEPRAASSLEGWRVEEPMSGEKGAVYNDVCNYCAVLERAVSLTRSERFFERACYVTSAG